MDNHLQIFDIFLNKIDLADFGIDVSKCILYRNNLTLWRCACIMHECVCVCVCACVHACVRVCVCARVRICNLCDDDYLGTLF